MRSAAYAGTGKGIAGEVSLLGLGAVTEGIDADAALCDLKVEVGAGGIAGGTGDADDLSLADPLAHIDLAGTHMGVEGGVAAAVGDDHIVTIRTGIGGDDHRAGLGGIDLEL